MTRYDSNTQRAWLAGLFFAACGPGAQNTTFVLDESMQHLTHEATTTSKVHGNCAERPQSVSPQYRLQVAPGRIRFRLSAESDVGPLALIVDCGESALCDDDGGTGVRPQISLPRVAEATACSVAVVPMRAPRAGSTLSYQVAIERETTHTEFSEVAVTITSTPSNLEVRDRMGRAIGHTPLMFAERTEASELVYAVVRGVSEQIVRGQPQRGALVLHADFPGPNNLDGAIADAGIGDVGARDAARESMSGRVGSRPSRGDVPSRGRNLPFTCADGRIVQRAEQCWVRCPDGSMAPAQQYCAPFQHQQIPIPPARNNRRN